MSESCRLEIGQSFDAENQQIIGISESFDFGIESISALFVHSEFTESKTCKMVWFFHHRYESESYKLCESEQKVDISLLKSEGDENNSPFFFQMNIGSKEGKKLSPGKYSCVVYVDGEEEIVKEFHVKDLTELILSTHEVDGIPIFHSNEFHAHVGEINVLFRSNQMWTGLAEVRWELTDPDDPNEEKGKTFKNEIQPTEVYNSFNITFNTMIVPSGIWKIGVFLTDPKTKELFLSNSETFRILPYSKMILGYDFETDGSIANPTFFFNKNVQSIKGKFIISNNHRFKKGSVVKIEWTAFDCGEDFPKDKVFQNIQTEIPNDDINQVMLLEFKRPRAGFPLGVFKVVVTIDEWFVFKQSLFIGLEKKCLLLSEDEKTEDLKVFRYGTKTIKGKLVLNKMFGENTVCRVQIFLKKAKEISIPENVKVADVVVMKPNKFGVFNFSVVSAVPFPVGEYRCVVKMFKDDVVMSEIDFEVVREKE